MSLLKAVKGSNAAKSGEQGEGIYNGESSSDPEKLGYSVFANPREEPAQSNSDVKGTKGSFDTDQEGTSIDAYKHQPEKVDAKTGK